MARTPPLALTFDVFGTVVDWRSAVIREGEHLTRSRQAPEIDWHRFADAWRAGYAPAMEEVRTGKLPWTPLDALHRRILDGLLVEFGVTALSEAQIRHLNTVWHRLDPWEDVMAGLELLRHNRIVATLSNGNVGLLVNLSKRAGLVWDCVLSAELARHYKPDAEVYQMAAALLCLEPNQIMMVAAHRTDLRAARAAGFQTAYVHRSGEKGPYATPESGPAAEFDVHASDFVDLARQLGAK